eukprot:CAMPEP_0172818922 /NCGR_PEP_ID=MMETSP1075-20121228/14233_1 /TAXON_ID=2916 /ORGANISM="Ceratium fusus, Strain PA161109" /LENGTH=75 /DNA_ID=CAMNT_0013659353 /DNA_START=265 /DNA_END=489 /DNA_ORIENTATION=+
MMRTSDSPRAEKLATTPAMVGTLSAKLPDALHRLSSSLGAGTPRQRMGRRPEAQSSGVRMDMADQHDNDAVLSTN